MSQILPTLLAGGSGTRLWPLSRELYPKQLLSLNGDQSMLRDTLDRVKQLNCEPAIVVCNEEHRFLIAEQLRARGESFGAIILEPVAKNTAPAIALAALHARSSGADPIMLILPADHVIADAGNFRRAVDQAIPLAEAGNLVTFGIVPEKPETGYGYIKKGAYLADGVDAAQVDAFVEKPDRAAAESYLASGDYFWNGGIFLFKASAYLEELLRFEPDIYDCCEKAIAMEVKDLDFVRPAIDFEKCLSQSIDYAVMEKTDRAVVVPLNVGWSDLGSWQALWEISEKDREGNVMVGDVVSSDTTSSFIYSDSRLVATLGLENTIVVETSDAVLVAEKDRVQEVKLLVEQLRSSDRTEHYSHARVYRPWGSYETITLRNRYQVKRITVNPGASLSLQMHHHRSEHWIVVSGTAVVQRDDEEFVLSENESTYIPLGAKHRLRNPGKLELDLIEVQVGSYLGEDDIVRFEDVYGRG